MNGLKSFEEIFISYLKAKKTDYAYMLTAKWGSGKTFYIKNKFLKNDYIKNFKTIYYSLNGLCSLNTLKKSVNLSILSNSVINKKNENFIKKLLTKVSEKLSHSENMVVNLTSNLMSSFSEEIADVFVSAELEDTIIIFDDLERISLNIAITDLLGEIFEKYIAKGAKVLFVCDESNLINEKESYEKEKEKYIRRTIIFEPSKEEIFIDLLNNANFYKNSSVKEQNYYFNALSFYYKNNSQPNFRNVKFIVDIFEEIYKVYEFCKKELTCEVINVNQIFYQVIVLSNLYKDGNTNENNLTNSQYYSYLAKDNKDISEDPYYQARLQLRQYPNSVNDLRQSVEDLVFKGKVDIKQLKEDIILQQDSLLKRLAYYKRFEENELVELLEAIIKNLEQKIYSVYDYAYLTKSFLPLAKKYLANTPEKELKNLIFESLKNFPNEFIDYHSKNYNSFQNFDFSAIPELQEYFEKLILKRKREVIEKFIQTLGDDESDFIYTEMSKSQNLFKEILKDKDSCLKILKQKNAAICTFMGLIREEILQISNARDFYNDCIPCLKVLDELIESEMTQGCGELKKEILVDFKNCVEKTIKHISKS